MTIPRTFLPFRCLLLVLLLFLNSVLAQNLIQDGNFEEGLVNSPWNIYSPLGWQFTTPDNSGNVTIQWWVRWYEYTTQKVYFNVTVDGEVQDSTVTPPQGTQWTQTKITVPLAPGPHTLKFAEQGLQSATTDVYIFLDDIVVESVSSSSLTGTVATSANSTTPSSTSSSAPESSSSPSAHSSSSSDIELILIVVMGGLLLLGFVLAFLFYRRYKKATKKVKPKSVITAPPSYMASKLIQKTPSVPPPPPPDVPVQKPRRPTLVSVFPDTSSASPRVDDDSGVSVGSPSPLSATSPTSGSADGSAGSLLASTINEFPETYGEVPRAMQRRALSPSDDVYSDCIPSPMITPDSPVLLPPHSRSSSPPSSGGRLPSMRPLSEEERSDGSIHFAVTGGKRQTQQEQPQRQRRGSTEARDVPVHDTRRHADAQVPSSPKKGQRLSTHLSPPAPPPLPPTVQSRNQSKIQFSSNGHARASASFSHSFRAQEEEEEIDEGVEEEIQEEQEDEEEDPELKEFGEQVEEEQEELEEPAPARPKKRASGKVSPILFTGNTYRGALAKRGSLDSDEDAPSAPQSRDSSPARSRSGRSDSENDTQHSHTHAHSQHAPGKGKKATPLHLSAIHHTDSGNIKAILPVEEDIPDEPPSPTTPPPPPLPLSTQKQNEVKKQSPVAPPSKRVSVVGLKQREEDIPPPPPPPLVQPAIKKTTQTPPSPVKKQAPAPMAPQRRFAKEEIDLAEEETISEESEEGSPPLPAPAYRPRQPPSAHSPAKQGGSKRPAGLSPSRSMAHNRTVDTEEEEPEDLPPALAKMPKPLPLRSLSAAPSPSGSAVRLPHSPKRGSDREEDDLPSGVRTPTPRSPRIAPTATAPVAGSLSRLPRIRNDSEDERVPSGVSTPRSKRSAQAEKQTTASPAGGRPRRGSFGNVDWEISPDSLLLVRELGSGAFGTVYLGKWRFQDVAIKKVTRPMNAKEREEFRKEVETIKSLRPHQNLVSLLGVCTEGELCIVYEYCARGNLAQYLTSLPSSLPYEQLLLFCLDISRGMSHLHEEGIIHRDLAARNLLLTENMSLKITDFGFARRTTSDDNVTATNVGPLKWMAPECLSKRVYSRKSDVYAFAITLVELLTRSRPYGNEEVLVVAMKVIQEGYRPKIPKGTPPDIRELILMCWSENPEERPNFDQIYVTLEALLQAYTEETQAIAARERVRESKKQRAQPAGPQLHPSLKKMAQLQQRQEREEEQEAEEEDEQQMFYEEEEV